MANTTSNPAALATVYEAVNDELVALGVRAAFGLMGEDTAALITDLIDRAGIAFYGTRHESVALSAADGYAWAAGELGVCILSRGPGVTNAVTAAVTAARSGRRVLILGGERSAHPRPRAAPGPDLKDFDHARLAEACGFAFRTSSEPANVIATLREAAATAKSSTPTLMTIPLGVLGEQIERDGQPWEPEDPPRTPPCAGQAEVASALALLEASERPLILAGGGAVQANAKPLLEALAAETGALLCTTLVAKDLFRGSQYDLGVLGGFTLPGPRELIDQADLMLAFGAQLTSFTTSFGHLLEGLPVIQVDIEASHIGRYAPVRLGIVADAASAAQQLLDGLDAPRGAAPFHHPDALAKLSLPAFEAPSESKEGLLDPRVLCEQLDEILPADRMILSDGGHHVGFSAMYMRVQSPHRFRFTLDFAAVGLGLGAAIGAAVARPQEQTVLFIGDGGLTMTLGDLETIVRYQLPLLIIVMNDCAYGAERHFLDLAGLPHEHAQFPDLDFAALADSLGLQAKTIDSLSELQSIRQQISTRLTAPLLLDCKIDPALRAEWLEEF